MALINGDKFRKITRRYRCVDEVLKEAREHIINNYCPSEHIQVGRCLITITDNTRRWIIPRWIDKFFDLMFAFRGIPGNTPITRETYLEVTYNAAEELTKDEFERRKVTLPVDEVLRKAKEIINPSDKY
jgi:hypothetical protein